MPRDEEKGRLSDDTETADQTTSHHQATSATDSSVDATNCAARAHLSFADLLGLLGFADAEYVSVCHKALDGPFLTEVCSLANAPAVAAALPDDDEIWFGVRPVKGPARKNAGRGRAKDVTRLSAVWADLDIEDGKCANTEVARAIIDELSQVVGMRPVAVTETGHGPHSCWAIQDGAVGEQFTNDAAVALLCGWKQLVGAVAEMHGAKADSVFDLARVLRVPDTYNNKGSR